MSRAQASLVQIFYLAFLFLEKKLPFIPLHIKEEKAYHKFSVVKPVSKI